MISWTLGCGYVNPVVGEHPLEFSLNRIFPSFWNPYILEADDGGSLFKYLVYFLLAAFVMVAEWWLCPVWSLHEWGLWSCPNVQVFQKFGLLLPLEGS